MSEREDSEILKDIYETMRDAEKKLQYAHELMKERKHDIEITACVQLGGRAGWSRFLTQLNQYVNQYGLLYLNSLEDKS